MRVFFDSSAFVKRYVREAGTDAVLAWCDQASEMGLSAIASDMISTRRHVEQVAIAGEWLTHSASGFKTQALPSAWLLTSCITERSVQ